MLRVAIAYAQPGMVLAHPVFHPIRHGTILLNEGLRLDRWSIDRLAELHIREVWIRYPGMEGIREFVCPEIGAAHSAIAGQVTEAFDRVVAGAHALLDYPLYRRGVASLVRRLARRPRAAILIQEMVHQDQDLVRHATGVCYLSTLMGLKLQDYLITQRSRLDAVRARDVSSLGLAAMLHDIGMLRLGRDVVERWRRTRDERDRAWRSHVYLGCEMVREAAGPSAASAILHHHQRFDGTGFPQRRGLDGKRTPIAGREIHVFSRIIAAADLFDRLRYPHGSDAGAPVPVVRALRGMRDDPCKAWIDPMVLKALLACVPPYPPGSLVKLSNGRSAVVVDWTSIDPCRPTVELVGDIGREHALDYAVRERLNLREHPAIEVCEVGGEPVRDANFYPASPDELDFSEAERALFNAA